MARRKKGFLEDGSDSDLSDQSGSDGFDSQEDEDSRAERRLFEHRRKRPRTAGRSGKAAAWEGVFGDDDDNGGRGGLGRRRGGAGTGERTDWTKQVSRETPADRDRAPTFVSKSDSATQPVESRASSPAVASESSNESESSDDASSRNPTPRIVETEDDEADAPRSGLGGIGFSPASAFKLASSDQPKDDTPLIKTAFGRASATRQQEQNTSGMRSNFQSSRSTTPSSVPKQTDLTRAEKAHFSTIAGSFGAKFLAKQGWAPGKGLGLHEDGRAVPVAVGSVMRGEGIRSGIRTEDSKREARRRGEVIEDESDVKPGKRTSRKSSQRPAASQDGWKKHRKVKVKVEHKTYEQLLAEEGIDSTRPDVGLVLDARGGEVSYSLTSALTTQLKAVESISQLSLSSWTPTSDATQLPELRHNLRLIVDVTRADVGNLIREGKAINERRRWSTRDEERSRQSAEASHKGNESVSTELTSAEIQTLEVIQSSVEKISVLSQREAGEGPASLHHLEESFNQLVINHDKEYRELGLDDVVVGAIDLVLRKTFAQWQPFEVSSDTLLSTLKPWKQAFNLEATRADSLEDASDRAMTAWESLLWHRWLPKVRSALNNDWDVLEPQPAVHLIESWDPILPRFIHDNILDQLILPRVTVAVEQWTGRPLPDGRVISLASIIFPWLPIMGERVESLLEEGKRRIRAVLRKWSPKDGVISELQRWRDDVSQRMALHAADHTQIFSTSEWDKLMGDFVLGKLGACLRDDFVINPRNQDLKPLEENVLPWYPLIRRSNFVRLFELEFFPKWLNVLYLWLVHPTHNADEVAQW